MDFKNAYCSIPVHPDDQHLLSINWEDTVLLDAALPFGLRSASKTFSAVANTLLWNLAQSGVKEAIHYLDNFLIAGRPGSYECTHHLATVLQMFERLSIQVANKTPKALHQPSPYRSNGFQQKNSKSILRELHIRLNRKACSKQDLPARPSPPLDLSGAHKQAISAPPNIFV